MVTQIATACAANLANVLTAFRQLEQKGWKSAQERDPVANTKLPNNSMKTQPC